MFWRNIFGKCQTVWKSKKFTDTHFFSSNQFSVSFLCKKLIWRNFCDTIVSVKFRTLHCGNYRNLLSRFFDKNFVKATHLLNKILNSWFDGKNSGESIFSFFHSVFRKLHSVQKYYKTRSRFIRKNQHFSVKSTFSLMKLLKIRFHEILWVWSRFIVLFQYFPHCVILIVDFTNFSIHHVISYFNSSEINFVFTNFR